jgi:hypothetical protein
MNMPANAVRTGAKLVFCAGSLLWSVHACAEDQQLAVAAAAPVQERQVVVLHAIKAAVFRNGEALLITERGPEYVKPERLALQLALKARGTDGFCIPH